MPKKGTGKPARALAKKTTSQRAERKLREEEGHDARVAPPFPHPWPLIVLRSTDGMRLALVVLESWTSGLCFFWGAGGVHKKPPKGWEIRKDRDRATGSGDVHYHCESDNDEYVVTAHGKGSHDTKAGTELPRKLGDFLHDDLKVPLPTNADGRWIVSVLPFAPPRFLAGLLDDVLNAEAHSI